MTVYTCPECRKGLVTEDPEPPGIIHTCDDCSERMTEKTEQEDEHAG